jgi:hypothetical protein
MFVEDPGSAREDAGVILSVVPDTRRGMSFLLALERHDFPGLARRRRTTSRSASTGGTSGKVRGLASVQAPNQGSLVQSRCRRGSGSGQVARKRSLTSIGARSLPVNCPVLPGETVAETVAAGG